MIYWKLKVNVGNLKTTEKDKQINMVEDWNQDEDKSKSNSTLHNPKTTLSSLGNEDNEIIIYSQKDNRPSIHSSQDSFSQKIKIGKTIKSKS